MCTHYETYCFIKAECCQEFFECRLCHNDEQNHEINRYGIQTIQCKQCSEVQEKSNQCIKCKIQFAQYYCDKCNLWCENEIFHCDKCNICYKIPKDKRIHCDECNLCFLIPNTHHCSKFIQKEKMQTEDCPICFDKLYYTTEVPYFLNCGHCIHYKCLKNMLNHGNVTCPICKKSSVDMDWDFLDKLIEKNPYHLGQNIKIFCNDCLKKSESLFHPFGIKCSLCKSYNTLVD